MLRKLLTPLTIIYGLLLALRNLFYDIGILKSEELPGKVLSVGNIAMGGTGKSPMVVAIARHLLKEGYSPAILSRGYKSGLAASDSLVLLGSEVIVRPEGDVFHGDESKMQAEQLKTVPVVVGQKRFRAAQRFLREAPEKIPTHWILDDGFQDYKIKKDLTIK